MIILNYIVAIAFTILWAIGFLARHTGPVIHIFLGAAFMLILINILNNDNNPNKKINP